MGRAFKARGTTHTWTSETQMRELFRRALISRRHCALLETERALKRRRPGSQLGNWQALVTECRDLRPRLANMRACGSCRFVSRVLVIAIQEAALSRFSAAKGYESHDEGRATPRDQGTRGRALSLLQMLMRGTLSFELR